jgi:hypothetical protein
MLVFRSVTPCGLIRRYHRFGRTYRLHLQGVTALKWRQYVSAKRWHLPTSPDGVTTQKTNTDIFIAVRTPNFIKCLCRLQRLVNKLFLLCTLIVSVISTKSRSLSWDMTTTFPVCQPKLPLQCSMIMIPQYKCLQRIVHSIQSVLIGDHCR